MRAFSGERGIHGHLSTSLADSEKDNPTPTGHLSFTWLQSQGIRHHFPTIQLQAMVQERLGMETFFEVMKEAMIFTISSQTAWSNFWTMLSLSLSFFLSLLLYIASGLGKSGRIVAFCDWNARFCDQKTWRSRNFAPITRRPGASLRPDEHSSRPVSENKN